MRDIFGIKQFYRGAELAARINICMAANDDNEWLGQRKSLKYVEWAASMRQIYLLSLPPRLPIERREVQTEIYINYTYVEANTSSISIPIDTTVSYLRSRGSWRRK